MAGHLLVQSDRVLANGAVEPYRPVNHLRRRLRAAADLDQRDQMRRIEWVPDHDALLRRWAAELPPGGWLALQVPANFDAPSHVLMRELAASPAWRYVHTHFGVGYRFEAEPADPETADGPQVPAEVRAAADSGERDPVASAR